MFGEVSQAAVHIHNVPQNDVILQFTVGLGGFLLKILLIMNKMLELSAVF